MPQYTNTQLSVIAAALEKKGYAGTANEIWWWNSLSRPLTKRLCNEFQVMIRPLKDMPLYIEDNKIIYKIIALTRLQLNV